MQPVKNKEKPAIPVITIKRILKLFGLIYILIEKLKIMD